ncbi:hypothetical protein [Butyricicoccus sp. OF10-2]|uniref:hypothetical protein n=1 Tax=Butyricicoccus sp. OF10-2 TaxID=2292298 RepID=UPI003FA4B8D5
MALGGGMYTVQNKVLPGAYINFVSAARASATLGDRGTAAFPLSLDWGPENEVVTIENSEFQKGSLALTGYAYTADELRPLREIFANAKTLHLFRLNSGGAKAACKYAEAKYPGKIGNELKIVIQQNEGFTVSTNESTTFRPISARPLWTRRRQLRQLQTFPTTTICTGRAARH